MRALILSLLVPSIAFANVCPTTDDDLGTTIGANIAAGDTTGFGDTFTPSCGSSTAEDFSFEFEASVAGEYTFSTDGSAYDTVLSLHQISDCLTEIACDDDTVGRASEILYTMAAGEKIIVNVDGYAANVGAFTLSIGYAPPPVCTIDRDLNSAVGQSVASGTTCGAGADVARATCGFNQDAEEYVFEWTAPAAGEYAFDLVGSDYDTAMTLRNNCTELACSDDDGPGVISGLSYTFAAGETVSVVVDGFGPTACGNFNLNIYAGCLDTDQDTICEDSDICFGDDMTGDSDADLTCDDSDFLLTSGVPTAGQALNLRVERAEPNAMVIFFVSTNGPGAGPCYAPAGICLDVLGPRVIGRVAANANGQAPISVPVPANVPAGTRVAFQAAWVGGGTGDTTEVDPQVTR
jgi:hypothetical protein